MPSRIRVRDGLPQQAVRLPAASAYRHHADQVPAIEEGLRGVQAWHGRHAQAIPGQPAHCREQGPRDGLAKAQPAAVCRQERVRERRERDERKRA